MISSSPNITQAKVISLLDRVYVKNNLDNSIYLIKKNKFVLKVKCGNYKLLDRAVFDLNLHYIPLLNLILKITAGGLLNDLKFNSNEVIMYNSIQQEEIANLLATSQKSISQIAIKLNEKPTVLRNKIYRNKKLSVNEYQTIKSALLGKTQLRITASDLIQETSIVLNDFNNFFNNLIKFIKTDNSIDTVEFTMCQSHTNVLKKELDDLLNKIKQTTNQSLEVM